MQESKPNSFAVIPALLVLGVTALIFGGILAFLLHENGPPRIVLPLVPVFLAIVLLLITAVVSSAVGGSERRARVYPAALWATVAAVPVVAAFGTVVVYVALVADSFAVLTGLLTALLVWLLVALLYRRYVTASSASLRNYELLREQLDQLKNRLDQVDEAERNTLAFKEARGQCQKVEGRLENGEGMTWVKGTGYIDLWHRVHRAEEALITIEPPDAAIHGAMHDESRLMGSNMTDKDSLLRRLRNAVAALDGSDTAPRPDYLAEPPVAGPTRRRTDSTEKSAKSILSGIRHEINNFRDNVWEGLVHARGRLVTTSVLLGFAAYALLGLAVLVGASPRAILWATVYFLIGAVVGLFARSRTEARRDTATDDFGLSTARLVHTPLFSGLAAVGGVLAASVLDAQYLIGPGESAPAIAVTLTGIFDGTATNGPGLVVIAAVFGLTPDLLIRRLNQRAEQYEADLQSTEANRGVDSSQPR